MVDLNYRRDYAIKSGIVSLTLIPFKKIQSHICNCWRIGIWKTASLYYRLLFRHNTKDVLKHLKTMACSTLKAWIMASLPVQHFSRSTADVSMKHSCGQNATPRQFLLLHGKFLSLSAYQAYIKLLRKYRAVHFHCRTSIPAHINVYSKH